MITACKKLIVFLLVFLLLNFLHVVAGTNAAYATSSLSLSPATATETVGSTFTVDIILDTAGSAVAGASAVITYDNTKLQVVGNQLAQGSIFNQAPLTNSVDTPSAGHIQYDSGSLGTSYTGRGTMATITFKALAAGTAQVNFVYTPGATTNTSIVALTTGSTNDLGTVNNGTYTITTGSSGTTLPSTGALENTLMVLGGGMIFLLGSAIAWFKSGAYQA